MNLKWTRDEQIRVVERYWAHGAPRCPRDSAVLQVVRDDSYGQQQPNVHFLCPWCGRHFWSNEVEKIEDPTSFEAQYEVIREIGVGGMGQVQLVVERATGKQLAAKRIKPELLKLEEAVRRFQREERILTQLRHDHIVPIHRSFVDETGATLLMPYMPNGTLKAAINDLKITPAQIVGYFEDVAKGLSFLHEQGFVHRDLKPDNVLIDGASHARISDFGLARLIDRDTTTLTIFSGLLGTPHYASPEQQQNSADVDRRCDIYALALIAYEIARRESPYIAPVHTEGLSEEFCAVFRRALARKAEDRTATPEELVAALRRQLLS
jgi:serine/threonine protein kinase